jgi:hypothetical protein
MIYKVIIPESIEKDLDKLPGLVFKKVINCLKLISTNPFPRGSKKPVLHDFNDLSINKESSREFEKKVNLVFKMLGFEVDELGQGSGRNPDGIAKENQFRYAIIID